MAYRLHGEDESINAELLEREKVIRKKRYKQNYDRNKIKRELRAHDTKKIRSLRKMERRIKWR